MKGFKKFYVADNGVVKIYMVNIFNGEEKLIKKILILNELFLTKLESKALVLPFIHR
ncbi:MAG: hypothetical protein ACQERB_03880 [Promethearchaeati archaeon]